MLGSQRLFQQPLPAVRLHLFGQLHALQQTFCKWDPKPTACWLDSLTSGCLSRSSDDGRRRWCAERRQFGLGPKPWQHQPKQLHFAVRESITHSDEGFETFGWIKLCLHSFWFHLVLEAIFLLRAQCSEKGRKCSQAQPHQSGWSPRRLLTGAVHEGFATHYAACKQIILSIVSQCMT